MKSLKHFDLYRKPNKDALNNTVSGGLLTLICFIVIVLLFLKQYEEFNKIEVYSDMFVDSSRGSQLFKVEFDISIFKMPCDILIVKRTDAMQN